MFKKITRRFIYKSFPYLKDANARLEAIEYAFATLATNPVYESDEQAFNRQAVRKATVTEIIKNTKPACIIETGTFLGDTTGYFASFGIPVISSEISPPIHYAAKQRLSGFSNVRLMLCDSRDLFKSIVSGKADNESAFIYLDAHWLDDLPLLEEIRIIDANWDNFIILIDDFQVPGDSGYGYDRYSKKRILNVSYISGCLTNRPIKVFFPNTNSNLETGAKRGYVFLAKGADNINYLSGMDKLKLY